MTQSDHDFIKTYGPAPNGLKFQWDSKFSNTTLKSALEKSDVYGKTVVLVSKN